jgi:ribosome-binding factor A
MAEARRPDRVAESIREQVASFLSSGVKDPRIKGFVTVTAVDLTRDLRHATVFVSVMGDDAAKKSTFEGLASVASHLRSMLGKSLRLHSAPEIVFKADESIARATRIEELLAQVRTEREANAPMADADADARGNGAPVGDGVPERASQDEARGDDA